MNGPGIYSVQYFPSKTEWIITKLYYDQPELNKVYYYTGEFKLEEYCIYLEAVGDLSAFTRGANIIEANIKGKA